jgi:hypothetical protein
MMITRGKNEEIGGGRLLAELLLRPPRISHGIEPGALQSKASIEQTE